MTASTCVVVEAASLIGHQLGNHLTVVLRDVPSRLNYGSLIPCQCVNSNGEGDERQRVLEERADGSAGGQSGRPVFWGHTDEHGGNGQ